MATSNSWIKSGWAYKAKSVADLMTAVTRLGTHKSTRRYMWRGQANMSWSLEPSLVRTLRAAGAPHDEAAVATAEKKLVTEARNWPAPEFAGLHSDQQLLSLLQHHGVPTGLMDVTTDPMTALWFACERDSDPSTASTSGVILAFDVTDWKSLPTESPNAYAQWSHLPDPLGEEYRQMLATQSAFIVEPSRPSGRMAAQRGRLFRARVKTGGQPFGVQIVDVTDRAPRTRPDSVLGSAKTPGQPPALPFAAIIIGTQQKTTLLRHLEGTFGINRPRLFPEVSGFAEAVKKGAIAIP